MAILNFRADIVPTECLIHLTFGRSKSEFRWSDKRELTFADLAQVLSKAEPGPKDGTCYTPATFTGFARRMDQAARIDVVVLDADCGHTLDEIENAVSAQGWRGIIHSTYSHLSDVTTIAAEAFDRWSASNSGADVAQFMLAKKGYLPRAVDRAHIVEELRDGQTRSYLVKHQPCPKFRIILPLETPWVAAEFDSQSLANAAWKERIGALSATLKLFHDQSCVDTSRLFYLPRVREGWEFVSRVIGGDNCPLWDLPEVVAEAPLLAAYQSQAPNVVEFVRPDHKIANDSHGEVINLTTWAAKYAGRFEITKAIKARAPHLIGSRRSGPKQHIECPNSADHVTGGADRTGTYIVNASEVAHAGLPSITSGFVIHCMHNGCASRDRLDHVAALLSTGKLSCSDLTDAAFLVADAPMIDASAIIAQSRQVSLAPNRGNIPASLYADLPDVMGEMHAFINDTSAKPQPALNLGATLAFMASAIGRKVQLQTWGIRPNIYALGIGYSGAGKERPLSAIKQMARAASLFEKLVGVEEVASDAGIINSVDRNPSQVMLLDEMSFLLSATNSRQAGPHMANVMSTLLKLYSSSHTVFKGKSYANEAPKIIDQPCVSLYGCSTPTGLFSALSSRDITSGLLSRIVLFDAGDHDPLGRPPASDPVPQSIIDWLKAWDAYKISIKPFPFNADQPMQPTSVMITAEAMEVAAKFEEEMHAEKIRARGRGMDPLYVRARENALKFALIRACSVPPIKTDDGPTVDESALRVDAETMRWATALSRAAVIGMDKGAREQIINSHFEEKIRNLREIIRKSGDVGITQREIRRTAAGRLPKKELEDVLTALSEARDVFYITNVTPEKRGRKRDAYMHLDFINLEMINDDE
jgi:hypothetical protein